MASFTAYPPSVLHPSSTIPLDIPSAHTILTTFLHLANLDPAYRPDSTLSERGPEANSSSGNPNLTLHHLNRIKLGLEGTNLGAEDLDAGFFGEGGNKATDRDRDRAKKRKWQEDRDADYAPIRTGIPKVISTAEEEDVHAVLTAQDADTQKMANAEGWQDREDFELAQEDEDVDVHNAQRDPAAAADREGIMGEEEMGRMITVHEDLEEEGEGGGTADGMDAQQLPEERDSPPTPRKQSLTEREKKERRERKKMRSRGEKVTAKMGKAREGPNEAAKTGNEMQEEDKKQKETSPKPRKKRRKRKSTVEG
jgi:hypothetical protein